MQTTIIIAHRLSTIRNADKICVVSEGRIIEAGVHDELVLKKGAYYDLIQLQVSDDNTAEQSSSESDPILSVVPANDDVTTIKNEEQVKVDKKVINEKAKIWKVVLNHKGWLASALLGGAMFGTIFPALGLLLSLALTAFYQPTSHAVREQSSLVAIYYIIGAIGAALGGVLLYYGSSQLSERISMRLRSMLFEALLRREIGFFDQETNAIGNLTNRLSNDSRSVSKASGELVAKTLQAFFTLVIGLIIGLAASWKLALVVLATFPLNAIAGKIRQRAMTGIGRKKDTANDDGKEGGIISAAFNNIRTVSAYSMHIKVLESYQEKTWSDSLRRQWTSTKVGVSVGLANGN